MKPLFLVLLLVASTAGCAQNQIVESRGSQPATKNFDSCGLSVQFSGPPEELRANVAAELANAVGVPIDGTAWGFTSVRQDISKRETVFCSCPDEPKRRELQFEVTRMSGWNDFVPGVGHVQQGPMIEVEGGERALIKITLGAASKCFLYQTVFAAGNPEVVKKSVSSFLSSVMALSKQPQNVEQIEPSQAGKSSVDRLKLLDQLLKEKLITPEEFNIRRAKIIDSL